MDKKQCSKCHSLKPISEFYRDDAIRTGYKSACKKCYNIFDYRNKKRRKFLAGQFMDTHGPFPKDLAIENLKRLTEAWKRFRYGHSLWVGWKLQNAYEANPKGIQFRRPTSNQERALLDFHAPNGERFTFDLSAKTPDKIADFISAFNVEIIYP